MSKYVRVMDGLKSNANGFQYKLNEVNIANTWNPNTYNPKEMGGFNFSSEDKILRWLHRGDTIYDVIIPEDAEVVLCDEEKGIFRANKIIVSNPKKITDEVVLDLYNKNSLSNKIIAQCLQTLLWKDRLEFCKYIIKDKVNVDNIDEILEEFEKYTKEREKVNPNNNDTNIIHDILKEIQSPIDINLYIDKESYIKDLSNDKVINITGESGSGKSYFSDKYIKDDNYIVIDTDVVFSDRPSDNRESIELRSVFSDKPKDYLFTNFDEFYLKVLDYFKDSNKTIVIDSAQYRNIKDYSILKGQLIVMRTSIETCYERTLNRYKNIMKDNFNEEDFQKYANKKKGMFSWYKGLNRFLEEVDKM